MKHWISGNEWAQKLAAAANAATETTTHEGNLYNGIADIFNDGQLVFMVTREEYQGHILLTAATWADFPFKVVCNGFFCEVRTSQETFRIDYDKTSRGLTFRLVPKGEEQELQHGNPVRKDAFLTD